MFKKIWKLVACIFLFAIVFLGIKIFVPRSYAVPPFQKRAGTEYWHLPTGSVIGYTKITAADSIKSYPIIYLHGGPGGAISDRMIQVFSPLAQQGHDVYLYDQVGSGQSIRLSNIEAYTTQRHVEDLEAIVQKTGAAKVILIGQSWGAILAVLFAAVHPDQIEKIVFTSPGPVYPVRVELAAAKAPDSFHLRKPYYSNADGNKKANNIRTEAMNFFALHFGWKLAADKEADEFATYLNYEVNKSVVCDTSKILPPIAGSGYYAGIMTYNSLTHAEDPRPQIKNSTIPVLVMKGQCDNQPWGFTNEYLELFPDHKLAVIPAAGHAISIEQPQLFIKTIADFINDK